MDQTGTPPLPDEILSLICEQLGHDREYATLYGCALACQSLADPALRIMYQYHELSPAFLQNEDVELQPGNITMDTKWKQAEQSFQKWTLIWRSIITSSLDPSPTYKPYCRYLRILDFRNLAQMLDDPMFQNTIRRDFFKGGLSRFQFLIKEGKRQVVDAIATINAIGEAVVPKTFLLEEISGNLSPGFLTRWIAHAPRLVSIVLFRGDALADKAGKAIVKHCENFHTLTIHGWRQSATHDPDEIFSQFLDDMKPISLHYFEMISSNDLQMASFKALGGHQQLQELRLGSLCRAAIENLNALKACTNLHTLVLHASLGTIQLDNEIFGEVVQWLSSCENLRELALRNIWDGPALLAQVISAPTVRLKKLSLEGPEGYKVRWQSAGAFHTALSEQKTLEYLTLRGDGEDSTPDDLDIMVSSLSELENLRELQLRDVSEEFEETHISRLALSLLQLEEFWTGGGEVSSNVLDFISNMRNLRTLNLYAQTQFTSKQILSFLESVDTTRQRGFSLFLMTADPAFDLTEHQQGQIRKYIQQNLDGRFDFQIWRDPEESDSDDD